MRRQGRAAISKRRLAEKKTILKLSVTGGGILTDEAFVTACVRESVAVLTLSAVEDGADVGAA
jgi:hypothetical protein